MPGQRNVIGKRIREARLAHRPPVSQEDLAARLAVRGVFFDRSAISRMEAEQRFVRDYEALAIADCLKVSIAWLFGRERGKGGITTPKNAPKAKANSRP